MENQIDITKLTEVELKAQCYDLYVLLQQLDIQRNQIIENIKLLQEQLNERTK